MEVLPFATRTGRVAQEFSCPASNTQLIVTATFGVVPPGAFFNFQIDQLLTADEWSTVGGSKLSDLNSALFDQGLPITSLVWTFTEQLVLNPHQWASVRDVGIRGRCYRQLALQPNQRLSVFTSTNVPYSVDVAMVNAPASAIQVNV